MDEECGLQGGPLGAPAARMSMLHAGVKRAADLVAGLLLLPALLSRTRRATVLGLLGGRMTLVGTRVPQGSPARAGLFCLWWLRRRSNIDYSTEAEADAQYLAQRSLRGDLAILLRVALASLYGAPSSSHAPSQLIGGVHLLNLRADDLLDAIAAALHVRIKVRVAFVNPDCVNIAAGDAEYRRCLSASDWVCADGIGMKIAGSLLRRPVCQNINGTDLFPQLCKQLASSGHSIYLLGARPGVAAAAAQWASAHAPGLSIAGSASGYFTPEQEPALIESIRASGASVLLVAMGAPRQEKWLDAHFGATGALVGMGVGGLFDFYSGNTARAPLWLREIGGEWLFRLIQEPGRMWRRYLLGNGIFLLRILLEKLRTLFGK
jgi:N-acetylglucosaminyldiphosphoundecaprenol N-acetyl-beta-D-mannosaminyltransferase